MAVDAVTRVKTACGQHSVMLILDNCEHVDTAPLVADLLSSVSSLRLLATSRAPLHVRGERQYALGPLALQLESETWSIADRARAPAVRLFVERVRDVQPEFRLTAANAATVTAICRRLDGLPLALELAASWMKTLTDTDLLNRLEHRLLPAVAGPRDLPARQQTMNATVAWSYQLLDPVDRRAFCLLGALPGRFSIDAAAALLTGRHDSAARDEALKATASLIDKSLLQRAESSVPNRPLFSMLETVRAYARLELSAAGERDDVWNELVGFCLNEVSQAAVGLGGTEQGEWLNRIRDEFESYRAALTWLIEKRRPADASDVAWGLGFFYLISGNTGEGLHWYERILALPALTALGRSKTLVAAGLMRWARGDVNRARAELIEAQGLAQHADGADLAVHAENILGHLEHAAGNLAAAREHYTRSLEGYRTLAIPWGVGNALSGLAGVTLTGGDIERAEPLLAEAAAVLRQAGPWFLAPVLCFQAVLAVQRGDADHAIALMRESLSHIRALHDKFAFVYALVPLAAAAVLQGDHAWAARLLGARDAVAESTGATIVDSGVQHLRVKAQAEARARLGPDGWAMAYAAGRTASIDSLLKDADVAHS
jgi:non-specific serine/threonine protein kinase